MDPLLQVDDHRLFWWKNIVLVVAIAAFFPLLYWQNLVATWIYVALILLVHVAFIVLLVARVRWANLARSTTELVVRLVALGAITWLLFHVGEDLKEDPGSPVFWWALGGLWILHAAGIALLHVHRRRRAPAA